MYRLIPFILSISKKHLTIFLIGLGLYIILYRNWLVHCLVVDNWATQRIDHV